MEEMTMIDYYKKVVFDNYVNFEGRARRSEYWYFVVANVLILFFSIIFAGVLASGGSEDGGNIVLGLMLLYLLAVVLPSIAVTVRRLHDTNKSGWYYLVSFIPYVGSIWLIILMATKGTDGTNKYGPDPKKTFSEIDEIGKTENIE